jgi:hypothetical protein
VNKPRRRGKKVNAPEIFVLVSELSNFEVDPNFPFYYRVYTSEANALDSADKMNKAARKLKLKTIKYRVVRYVLPEGE